MKKFWAVAMALKERTAMIYTGAMCFYLFFMFVFQWESVPLRMLFSMLLVSIAAALMQILAFSNLILKKLSYTWRLVVFALPFGAVLTACAVVFHWFPIENPGAWITFGVIFVVIFVLCTAGFELYFRLSGRKYDDKLDWYKKNREEK